VIWYEFWGVLLSRSYRSILKKITILGLKTRELDVAIVMSLALRVEVSVMVNFKEFSEIVEKSGVKARLAIEIGTPL